MSGHSKRSRHQRQSEPFSRNLHIGKEIVNRYASIKAALKTLAAFQGRSTCAHPLTPSHPQPSTKFKTKITFDCVPQGIGHLLAIMVTLCPHRKKCALGYRIRSSLTQPRSGEVPGRSDAAAWPHYNLSSPESHIHRCTSIHRRNLLKSSVGIGWESHGRLA